MFGSVPWYVLSLRQSQNYRLKACFVFEHVSSSSNRGSCRSEGKTCVVSAVLAPDLVCLYKCDAASVASKSTLIPSHDIRELVIRHRIRMELDSLPSYTARIHARMSSNYDHFLPKKL